MTVERDYPEAAARRVAALVATLRTILQRDPEQEVQGVAIPVLEACLVDVKAALPDDPVVAAVVEIFSADRIGSGDPIRAADMLLVAEQIQAAIGNAPTRIPGIA